MIKTIVTVHLLPLAALLHLKVASFADLGLCSIAIYPERLSVLESLVRMSFAPFGITTGEKAEIFGIRVWHLQKALKSVANCDKRASFQSECNHEHQNHFDSITNNDCNNDGNVAVKTTLLLNIFGEAVVEIVSVRLPLVCNGFNTIEIGIARGGVTVVLISRDKNLGVHVAVTGADPDILAKPNTRMGENPYQSNGL